MCCLYSSSPLKPNGNKLLNPFFTFCTMKRLLFFFTLVFVSMNIHATGQEGDMIYIDGVKWELLGKPVYADSVLSRELREALPKGRGMVSSNWAGYTAYWSIQQEHLCLDSIQYEIYDADPKKSRTECLPSDTLLRVFRKYVDGKRIVATWLNGNIRLAKGNMIYYVHSGFERNYEKERLVSIVQGKVGEMKDYQNYIVEGFSFDRSSSVRRPGKDSRPMNNAELRKKFPLHIENYPELAGVKRILFYVKRAQIDAQGHMVDCEIKVFKPNDNPRLAAEMAEAMKAYYPWQVSYINGEFRSYGIQGYSFPYILEE